MVTTGKQIGMSCAAKADASDINAKIAKVASDNKLNREQTARLVEEANKALYLENYRLTGNQVFDVASYDAVVDHLSPDAPLDKTAEDTQRIPNTAVLGLGVFGSPYHRQAAMLKTAKDQCAEYVRAITKELAETTAKFDGWMQKIAAQDQNIRNMTYEDTLNYLSRTNTKLAQTLTPVYRHINKLYDDRRTLEKAALEGYTVPFQTPPQQSTIQSKLVDAVKRAQANRPTAIGNQPAVSGGIRHAGRTIGPSGAYEKTAYDLFDDTPKPLWGRMKDVVKDSTPKALVIGGLVGTGYAAKKLYDVYEKRKQKKEMERNFDYVISKDPDIAANPNTRSYFNTIANFSPSLAKDPNMLSTLLNQFNTFDGIDLNTVKAMREIEQPKSVPKGENLLSLSRNLITT